jgi:hypothetical protein
MVSVGLRCLYACPRADAWDTAADLYQTLDALVHGTNTVALPAADQAHWATLAAEVDRVDGWLTAAAAFARGGWPLPLSAFRVSPPPRTDELSAARPAS